MDMSDVGPSHIINIKKEKRETDEETKQILRMLEKDDVGTSRQGEGAAFVMKSTSREPGWGKLSNVLEVW